MICGIDEAGRGPVLGPLVVAGVLLKSDIEIKELNVRDSKKLSPKRRILLAEEIKKIAEIEIAVLSAHELDILRQVFTLNEIEVFLFSKIIRSLKPESAFVDAADVNEENFKNNILSKLDFDVKLISKHGADDIFPVVSAASIIAKTKRDSEIQRISKEIGQEIGSGYPSDPITVDFIKRWLEKEGTFPPYIRYSWKTTQKLWEDFKYKPTTLDDY